MNNITLAGLFITSPSVAFGELRERPRFLVALIIILAVVILQLVWYYSIVDIEWLKDHMYSGNARVEALPPDAKARMMSMMTQKTMIWSSAIFMAILMPLIFAIIAGYYALAGKITNVKQTYKQWFALTVWSALPMLIGTLSGLAILFTQDANAQLGPSELQILSANELFFHRTPAQPGFQLLTLLNPITLWMWALAIVGVKSWSKRSWTFSAVYVLLPMVIVFGLGAMAAF